MDDITLKYHRDRIIVTCHIAFNISESHFFFFFFFFCMALNSEKSKFTKFYYCICYDSMGKKQNKKQLLL